MFNFQLDRMPSEYCGYLIRTDFRIGIQIIQCLKDDEYDEAAKVATCLELLYGAGIPRDLNVAIAGLNWFMTCGDDHASDSSEECTQEIYDFDVDSKLLYSAFMKSYGMDLTSVTMHWFKFVALMSDLSDSAFAEVVGYRSMDISELKGKQREKYARIKAKFALPTRYSAEEKDAINKFMEANGIGG